MRLQHVILNYLIYLISNKLNYQILHKDLISYKLV